MGLYFFCSYLPAARLDEGRKGRLLEIVAAAGPIDWEDRGYVSPEECKDEMVSAVEYVYGLPNRETVVIMFPGAAYPFVLTGGMSTNDPPTDGYVMFEALWRVPGAIEQLAIWAQEDLQADKETK
jgi:hypothetical protein